MIAEQQVDTRELDKLRKVREELRNALEKISALPIPKDNTYGGMFAEHAIHIATAALLVDEQLMR